MDTVNLKASTTPVVTPERTTLSMLAVNATLVYVGSLAVLALGFVLKWLLARSLSPFDLGLLLTGQMIISLAQNLAQLIVPDAVTRFVSLYVLSAMGKAKQVLLDALKINLGMSVFTVLALVAGANLIANVFYRQPRLVEVLAWLALSMPLIVFAETLAAASRGLGQIWVKVICLDIARLLGVLLLVGGLVLTGSNTLLAIIGAYIGSILVAAFLTGIAFQRYPNWATRAEHVSRGEMLRYSLPLLANRFASWPSTLLPLWLGSLVSIQIVSYFSLSSALSSFIYMPIMAMEFSILPVWGRLISQGNRTELNRLYLYTTRWGYALGSIVFALLFLCPATVLSALYGPAYSEGAPILQVVAITILAGALTGTNNSLLYAFGHTRQVLMGTVAGGLVALIGGVPLIMTWGLAGGLLILALSQLVGIGLYAIFLYREQRIHPLHPSFIKTLLASGIAILITALCQPCLPIGAWGAVAVVGLYTILLFIALAILRVFDEQDVRVMARIWVQIKGLRS